MYAFGHVSHVLLDGELPRCPVKKGMGFVLLNKNLEVIMLKKMVLLVLVFGFMAGPVAHGLIGKQGLSLTGLWCEQNIARIHFQKDCPICREVLGTKPFVALKCVSGCADNKYHKDCIAHWVSNGGELRDCFMCRQSLIPSPYATFKSCLDNCFRSIALRAEEIVDRHTGKILVGLGLGTLCYLMGIDDLEVLADEH